LDLQTQDEALSGTIDRQQSALIERQPMIDRLRRERRGALDLREELHPRRSATLTTIVDSKLANSWNATLLFGVFAREHNPDHLLPQHRRTSP
jgi:hypothetical protein